MRFVKDEFVRFFTAGFVGGALIVAATMGLGSAGATASPLAHGASPAGSAGASR